MADLTKLARLNNGVVRTIDIEGNTLVTTSVKVGGATNTELTKVLLDKLVLMEALTDAAGKHTAGNVKVVASASNYTAATADVEAHLAGIDTALLTAGADEVADNLFRIIGSATATKKVAFEVDGLTAATTRTITMPDTNVDLGDIATNSAKVTNVSTDLSEGTSTTTTVDVNSSDGTNATLAAASTSRAGLMTKANWDKLDGIEALADVTDSTNVDAAGATMNADTDVSSNSWVLDEDNMSTDSNTKLATQQSIKKYVDDEVASAITSEMSFKGDYNASTNSPDLDTSPIATAVGDTYVVSVAGTFFSTALEIGDQIMAKQATATAEAHWSIIQANLTPSTIKTQYESNSDTNALTDAYVTLLGNTSNTNSGDEAAASDTVAGVIELATVAETDTGTATDRAVTPAGLVNIQSDVDANTAKVTYSAATAKGDLINDSISDGNTDTAASENAVFDALAGKAPVVHTHNNLVKTMVAGESFAANTTFLVRMAITGETAGRVYKADKDAAASDKFYVIGIVEGDGAGAISAAGNIDVILLGEATLGSSDTDFAAGEIGQAVHLLATGAFDTVSQITYATNEASYRCGMVQETDKILVGNMQLLGIN